MGLPPPPEILNGWTGELWWKTNLINWQNLENFFSSFGKKMYFLNLKIFLNKSDFCDIFQIFFSGLSRTRELWSNCIFLILRKKEDFFCCNRYPFHSFWILFGFLSILIVLFWLFIFFLVNSFFLKKKMTFYWTFWDFFWLFEFLNLCSFGVFWTFWEFLDFLKSY